MRVGFAKNDITPRVGVELCGFGPFLCRKSIGIRDRLWARAMAIELDGKRMVLVTCDLAGTSLRRYADVTFRCQARTKAQARALALALKLNGTDPGTGLAGYGGTVNSTRYDAWLEDEQTSLVPADDGSDKAYYIVFSNYVITWAESA